MSFSWPHQVPGRELSEFLSAYYLWAKANSPSFSQNSPSLPQNSVRLSEFSSPKQYSQNSIPPVSYKCRSLKSGRKAAGKRHFLATQLFQSCSALFRLLQRSFWQKTMSPHRREANVAVQFLRRNFPKIAAQLLFFCFF